MKLTILGNIQSIHVRRWAQAFFDKGLLVHVISQQQAKQKTPFPVTELSVKNKYGYVLNFMELKVILEETKPDILHIHYAGGYGLLGILTGYKPLIMTAYGSEVFDAPQRSFLHKKVIQKILRSADLITSSSMMMKKEIDSFLSDDNSTKVVPFGVDTAIFNPLSSSDSDKIKIGCNKHLLPKYGIDILIKAFEKVLFESNNKHIELHIAGEGKFSKKYKQLAQSLHISESIFFHGEIEHDKMPEFLNSIDIFCAPSIYDSESFGVSILEASACGLPVIVSNAGGLPEVCKHEKTGLIVRKNDIKELADAMIICINSTEKRNYFGQNGRKYVKKNYEWSDCVDEMHDLYHSLLEVNT